jgi:hypothetical protein
MPTKSVQSKQLAVRTKKRIRTVESPDWNVIGNDTAKTRARKPAMQMKGRRFDFEGWLARFCEVKINGVIWRRTDRG